MVGVFLFSGEGEWVSQQAYHTALTDETLLLKHLFQAGFNIGKLRTQDGGDFCGIQ